MHACVLVPVKCLFNLIFVKDLPASAPQELTSLALAFSVLLEPTLHLVSLSTSYIIKDSSSSTVNSCRVLQ
jgi:hypothetical protein